MWVLTTTGFYSAVASDESERDVVVRARHRGDLTTLNSRLRALDHQPAQVLAYAHSDYPWRIVIAKTAWGDFLADEAKRIDYRNFKNEVTRRSGQARHDIYSRIWGVLLGLEKLPGAMKDHAKVVKRTPQRPSRWAKADAEWAALNAPTYHGFLPTADDDLLGGAAALAEAEADWQDEERDPSSPFYVGPLT